MASLTLPGALLATLVLAFGLTGGTAPGALAPLHLLMALAAWRVHAMPDRVLERSGRAARLAGVLAALAGISAFGLLPLPMGILRWLSPGVAEAFPDHAWSTLSMRPEATVSEMGVWLLLSAFAMAAGVYLVERGRRQPIFDVILGLGLGLPFAAALHRLSNTHKVFGVLPIQDLPAAFFGPLVNPNHAGVAMAMLVPPLVAVAIFSKEDRPGRRALAAIGAAACLAVVGWIGSPGVVLALVVGGLAALRRPWVLGLAGVGAIGGLVVGRSVAPDWWETAVLARWRDWAVLPEVGADFWFAGTGAGAFYAAVPPYRSPGAWERLVHVHNEPAEWILETGLVGVVAVAVIARRLPWATDLSKEPRGRGLAAGLVVLGVQSLYDFAPQLPAVALLAVGMLSARVVIFEVLRPVSPQTVRWGARAVGALQLAFALWAARDGLADVAARQVQAGKGGGERVALLAPWRAEALLEHAQRDPEAARRMALRHQDDAKTLRQAALFLSRSAPEEAEALLLRAQVRAPSDYRTWLALSRLQSGEEAARTYAEALRRWPLVAEDKDAPLDEAYELLPVALWWLEQLRDGPAWWSATIGRRALTDGDGDTAVLAYEQAARLDPGTYACFAPHARALVMSGRPQEARSFLERCFGGGRSDPVAVDALGDALAALGQPAEAVEVWLQAPVGKLQEKSFAKAVALAGKEEPREGLKVADTLALSGRSTPLVAVEAARLEAELGNRAGCLRRVEEGHVLETDALRAQGEQLLRRCGQTER